MKFPFALLLALAVCAEPAGGCRGRSAARRAELTQLTLDGNAA